MKNIPINPTIKFVYFDIGGVLLLDYSGTNKWIEMKRDLGVTEEFDSLFETIWDETKGRICIDCDVDTLTPKFEEAMGINFVENYSMLDDFVNRFEINPSIWSVVKKAKEKYKVGLLTNMYPRMFSKIIDKGLIPNIAWDVIIDSSIVGYKKPQEDIYKIAEKESGVNPEEIFFIDNQQRHLDTASRRGWSTKIYDPKNPEESSLMLENLLGLSK